MASKLLVSSNHGRTIQGHFLDYFETVYLRLAKVSTRQQFDAYVTNHWQQQKKQLSRSSPLHGPVNGSVILIIQDFLVSHSARTREAFNNFATYYFNDMKTVFRKSFMPTLKRLRDRSNECEMDVIAATGGLMGNRYAGVFELGMGSVGDPYEDILKALASEATHWLAVYTPQSWKDVIRLMKHCYFSYNARHSLLRHWERLMSFADYTSLGVVDWIQFVVDVFEDRYWHFYAQPTKCMFDLLNNNQRLPHQKVTIPTAAAGQRQECMLSVSLTAEGQRKELPLRSAIPGATVAAGMAKSQQPYIEIFYGTSGANADAMITTGIRFVPEPGYGLDFNDHKGHAVYFGYNFVEAAAWARRKHISHPQEYVSSH